MTKQPSMKEVSKRLKYGRDITALCREEGIRAPDMDVKMDFYHSKRTVAHAVHTWKHDPRSQYKI